MPNVKMLVAVFIVIAPCTTKLNRRTPYRSWEMYRETQKLCIVKEPIIFHGVTDAMDVVRLAKEL